MDKKMKTNQIMTVNFGKHKFHIYHKDGLGCLNELIDIGNEYRKEKGLKPIPMQNLLRKQGIFEFILMLENKQLPFLGVTPEIDNQSLTEGRISENLEDYKDKNGKLILPKKLKVLKSKTGPFGGTYVYLNILIRIAMELSSELADEIIETFIEGQLLEYRDAGGDTFNKLHNTFKRYIMRNYNKEPAYNDYVTLSTYIKKTVDIEDWNLEPKIKHKFRVELHDMLIYIYSDGILEDIVVSKLLDSVISRYEPKMKLV